jgi:isocitrate/isopropylmalate dehydrogenase
VVYISDSPKNAGLIKTADGQSIRCYIPSMRIARIVRVGFEIARTRKKKLISVIKQTFCNHQGYGDRLPSRFQRSIRTSNWSICWWMPVP